MDEEIMRITYRTETDRMAPVYGGVLVILYLTTLQGVEYHVFYPQLPPKQAGWSDLDFCPYSSN